MSDTSQGPGWWQASDGKWYPPESAPGAQPAAAPQQFGAPQFGAPAGGAAVGPGGAPLAEWAQRVVAYLIDFACILAFFIVGAIITAILGAISSTLGALVGLLLYVVYIGVGFYIGYLNGAKGQSPGKALTGLKVISEETGQVIGGGMGIVRQIAHFVDGMICYIGFLFPLWDAKKQTIADKLIKTVVISGVPKQSFGPDIFKP